MKKIQLIFILTLILISCGKEDHSSFTSEHFKLVEIADGVYGCIHKLGGRAICNAGIIDNGESTIIFDSFLSPDVADELMKVVSAHGLSQIRYVVNSHFHIDHSYRFEPLFQSIRLQILYAPTPTTSHQFLTCYGKVWNIPDNPE